MWSLALRVIFRTLVLMGIWYGFLSLALIAATANASERMITIAVLDSGIDTSAPEIAKKMCKFGHKDFTGQGLNDVEGHGTFMASMIVQNITAGTNYCLINVKFYQKTSSSWTAYINALRYLGELRPTVVNMSLAGGGFKDLEYSLIRSTLTTFITAAGNESRNISVHPTFPASYKTANMIVIGAVNKDGSRLKESNYGPLVDYWENGYKILGTTNKNTLTRMSGTSVAAAIFTGKYVNLMFLKPRK